MSFSVGNYTRTIDTPVDEFDQRVRAFKDDSLDSMGDKFEFWTAEQVKEAGEGFARADGKRNAINQAADAFLEQHPEIKDTKANGEAFNRTLKALFGEDCVPTIEHFETARRVMLANNTLDIDKKKLAEIEAQQKAAAKQQAEAERQASVPPSIDELYSMPLEDLRRLDAVENQRRMQEAGERGGSW
jgi:hypothetical protein